HTRHQVRVGVAGGTLERPVVAYLVVDIRLDTVDTSVTHVGVETAGGTDIYVIEERLQVFPIHVVGRAVPQQPACQAGRLPAEFVVIARFADIPRLQSARMARSRQP